MTQLLPYCEEPSQQELVSVDSVALPLEWYVPIVYGAAVRTARAADFRDRWRLETDTTAVRERAYLWTKRLLDIVIASLAIALTLQRGELGDCKRFKRAMLAEVAAHDVARRLVFLERERRNVARVPVSLLLG